MVAKSISPFPAPPQTLRVLITGATGGLGSALCRVVLDELEPKVLWAVGRSQAKLTAMAASLGQPAPLQTLAVAGMAETDLAKLATTIRSQQDALDVWLHCVGQLHGGGLVVEKSLRDLKAEALVQAFQINTVAFLLLAKHLKPLLPREGGSVVAALSAKVGSIGDNQLGGWYSYRISKAALNMAVRNVALELKRSGCAAICVAIHPGTTATPLSHPFTKGYSPAKLYSKEQSAARILNVIRGMQPEDTGGFFNWDGTALPW